MRELQMNIKTAKARGCWRMAKTEGPVTGVGKGAWLVKDNPGEAARGAIMESLEVPGGGTRLDLCGQWEPGS